MDAHDRKPKPESSQRVDFVLTGFQPFSPVFKVEEQSIDNSHGSMGHTVPPMEPEGQINENAKYTISCSSSDNSGLFEEMETDTKFVNPLSNLREDRVKQDGLVQSWPDRIDSSIQSQMDGIESSIQGRLDSIESSIQSQIDSIGSSIQGRLDSIESSIQASKVQPAESSTSADVKKAKEQLKNEKKKYSELRKDYNGLAKEHRNLTLQHEEQADELERAEAELRDALDVRDQQQTLMDGRPLANASKETDGTIISLWTQIAYDIRQLAHLLANQLGSQELDDIVAGRLRTLTPDYHKFLSSQDHCIDLMQGYLWVVIRSKVFSATLPLWGGPQSRLLKRAKKSLYNKIASQEEFTLKHEVVMANAGRCFAEISMIFNEVWDEDEALINRVINEETKIVEPFFPKRHGRTDRANQKVREQFEYIFRTAIKLDKITTTSKAFFGCSWHGSHQKCSSIKRFNKGLMTSDNHENALTPKSRVHFFVSPMMMKTGTADGQNYDCTIILQKAKVVCD